jgi:hypothetical protein
MQPPEVLEDSPFKENHCKHGNEQESKFSHSARLHITIAQNLNVS